MEFNSGLEIADRIALDLFWGNSFPIDQLLSEANALPSKSMSLACALGDHKAAVQFAERQDVNAPCGPDGRTPLAYVCFSRLIKDGEHRPKLVETAMALLEFGADPNSNWTNPGFEQTPESCLYGATGIGNFPELAELLLKHGANPNDGESMYHSAELENPDCLRLLLSYGGSIREHNALARLLDFERPSWIQMVLGFVPNPIEIPPVITHALRRGRSAEIISILAHSGMNLDEQNRDNLTPYQVATRLGRIDAAEVLERTGAETSLTDLDILVRDLSLGAKVDGPWSLTLDSESDPMLVIWAEQGNDLAIRGALGVGASPNVYDVNGSTALHQASWQGRLEIVKLLLDHGANPNIEDSVHKGLPIGWATFGSDANPNVSKADYAKVINLLIGRGSRFPGRLPQNEPIRDLLMSRGMPS